MSKKDRIPELLAPAGNFAKLKMAVQYGADAVYLGGEKYSLRAKAGNFSLAEMKEAVAYAHERGVKVYVTVNIFAHNRDFVGLQEYLLYLAEIAVDALIVADPGIFFQIKKVLPQMVVHLSTQANITNSASVNFWASQGVVRVNLARELSHDEIGEIRRDSSLELEVFVHGSVCISYSGRCLLSNYLTDRDANQGECSHPCRYSYHLLEEKRPGEYFPVEEDERGTYIFNSQDICLLPHLPKLIALGVDSLKIEGRMKTLAYVGSVVRVYRAALDWLQEQLAAGEDVTGLSLPAEFLQEVERVGTRGGADHFFMEPASADNMLYDNRKSGKNSAPAGIVVANSPLLIDVRSPINIGDKLEYLGRNINPVEVVVISIVSEKKESVDRANPGTRVFVETKPSLDNVAKGFLLRKVVK